MFRLSIKNLRLRILVAAGIAVFCAACSDDEKKDADASTTKSSCVPLGGGCEGAPLSCCSGDGAETKCVSGTCQVCATNGQSCESERDCCDYHQCSLDGLCCRKLRVACEQDDDCCTGHCGIDGCCLPAGFPTTSILDCCSGQARDVYAGQGASRYYVESDCL